jgi:hypothetical protein
MMAHILNSSIINRLNYKQALILLNAVNNELLRHSLNNTSRIIHKMDKGAASVLTEDLGKIFEKGICLLYETPYDGKYKYSEDDAMTFKLRLSKLQTLFPKCRHTAKGGALYDFTSEDGKLFLSAKTTKGDAKIAPQYIGQATPDAFCTRIGIPILSVPDLKKYIQDNIGDILSHIDNYTFSCPTVYYNKKTETIKYITKVKDIPWNTYQYMWTKSWDKWENSSTLKIITPTKNISILEIQFHSSSRTNMAVRWSFENVLTNFKDYLQIELI